MNKKAVAIIGASITAVAVAVVLAIYFVFIKNDIIDIPVSEKPFGITWDTSFEEAKNILSGNGYKLDDTVDVNILCTYDFTNLNGIEGADGKVCIRQDDNGIISEIYIMFNADMDKKLLETLAYSYESALDELLTFKVTKEDFEEIYNKSVSEDIIYSHWVGGTSVITVKYKEANGESSPLMVGFEPTSGEYGQYLLNMFN